MGTWSEGIFANDTAMDTVCRFEKRYNEFGGKKALELCRKDENFKFYNECKLSVAAIESFITGTVSNKNEIIDAINDELSDINISTWNSDCVEKRINVLNNFLKDISDSKENKEEKSKAEVRKFINDLHSQDIFAKAYAK